MVLWQYKRSMSSKLVSFHLSDVYIIIAFQKELKNWEALIELLYKMGHFIQMMMTAWFIHQIAVFSVVCLGWLGGEQLLMELM